MTTTTYDPPHFPPEDNSPPDATETAICWTGWILTLVLCVAVVLYAWRHRNDPQAADDEAADRRVT
jgi:hypothetical protein